MRSSRQDTEHRREAIVDAAARLVREKGLDGVSVPALMAEVGMTHGGFYRHFESKEALAPLAFERAFEQTTGRMEGVAAKHPHDPAATMQEIAAIYLSAEHRDQPGLGCPSSALAGDMARGDVCESTRSAYVAGVSNMIDEIEHLSGGEGAEGRAAALRALATMVGAILLARATRGNGLSEEILAAAREGLGAPD